jgi:hypothetical protein
MAQDLLLFNQDIFLSSEEAYIEFVAHAFFIKLSLPLLKMLSKFT